MCNCPVKYTNTSNWSSVFNCCIKCPGDFFPNKENNDEKDMDLLLIHFCHCEIFSSCYLHKHLLPENGKPCPSCMNLEDV